MTGSRAGVRHGIWRGLLHAALSVGLAWALLLFVLEPVRVEGYSMLPRLQNNERLFIDRIGFQYEPLRRGDIVVFHYPRDPRLSFIKRIIGLPGEKVSMEDGVVYIDGRRLVEPYVLPKYRGEASFAAITVPPDAYFVLGDHRDRSNDSRDWGCLPTRDIFGRAVFAYWPMQDLGLIH